MNKELKIWPYIVLPFAFFGVLFTSSMLLSMLWTPLAVLPVAGYLGWAIRHNLKRCTCGHRFASHSGMLGWCMSCPVSDLCKDPETPVEAAQRFLQDAT